MNLSVPDNISMFSRGLLFSGFYHVFMGFMELDDELNEYGLHAPTLREDLCLTLTFSVIGYARSFGIFSSFCAYENTREWLQECARCVIKLNRWVSCVNL